ncbi:MAG TPA: hypothetical protein VH083_17545 [Myxococcales bacterium]|jgi:hypothetical protein|nr:hypothetical protein [Myxococcales bacterium]
MIGSRQILRSALLQALAFNLTFFVQELFLVLPKALTPGLRPTLFHNNHTWQGDSPLASLFQGTGALAIFLLGLGCALFGRRSLFWLWMAFDGLFQSLTQVVLTPVFPGSDVGLAMSFFGLGATARAALVVAAVLAMVFASRWFARRLPGSFFAAGLLALLLVIPFRVPRELLEVAVFPALVTVPGLLCIQLWTLGVAREPVPESNSIGLPLLALLALLLVFQLLLRPGIRFY